MGLDRKNKLTNKISDPLEKVTLCLGPPLIYYQKYSHKIIEEFELKLTIYTRNFIIKSLYIFLCVCVSLRMYEIRIKSQIRTENVRSK